MSDTIPPDHISKKRVVYFVPGMDAVTVRREGEIDIYYPAVSDDAAAGRHLVTGFADAGAERRLGCRFKEMGSFVSWAQLTAASGMAAITYANTEPSDIHVLHHVRTHAATLRIDATRLGVWACSGHGPNALSLLLKDYGDPPRSATLLYPYTLDVAGSTAVADAARQFGFAVPAAGNAIDDLRADVPVFMARAGQDQMPGLNRALDAFVSAVLDRNLQITIANHGRGPHGFDVFADSGRSHEIIRTVLRFLQWHLGAFS
jgi:hypothetical protein